jgi:hypothetical protein
VKIHFYTRAIYKTAATPAATAPKTIMPFETTLDPALPVEEELEAEPVALGESELVAVAVSELLLPLALLDGLASEVAAPN